MEDPFAPLPTDLVTWPAVLDPRIDRGDRYLPRGRNDEMRPLPKKGSIAVRRQWKHIYAKSGRAIELPHWARRGEHDQYQILIRRHQSGILSHQLIGQTNCFVNTHRQQYPGQLAALAKTGDVIFQPK